MPKTGSTSLQNALAKNREALRRHGMVYPKLGGSDWSQHKGLIQVLCGNAPRNDGVTEGWLERFRAETADAHICILSWENIWRLPMPEKLTSLIPRDRTRVVMYVREPIAHWASIYRQRMKNRNMTMSFLEFANFYRPCIFPAAERWAAVFGRKNIVVRLYGRDGERWDIVSDFANLIGLRELEDAYPSHVYELKPGMAGNLLFVKQILNFHITREECKSQLLRRELMELANWDPAFRGKIPVDQETVDLISQKCQEDLGGLERRFGVSVRPRDKPVEAPVCPDLINLARDFERILAFARERNGRLAPLLERVAGMFDRTILLALLGSLDIISLIARRCI